MNQHYQLADNEPEMRGAENLVAISATFHTHPRYGAFYDKYADRINGFTGIYDLVGCMGKTLSHWEENAGGKNAYDNVEIIWDDLVGRYVDQYIATSLADPDRILPDTGKVLIEAMHSLGYEPKAPTKPAKPNRDSAKMEAALIAVAHEIEYAVDTLDYESGLAVTALEGWQIERIFDGLRTVMVQVDEALAHLREPESKARVYGAKPQAYPKKQNPNLQPNR